MIGYRHADHAGNFADVHKHVLLRLLLRTLRNGPGPLTYVESHAGAGAYTREPGGAWEDGLGRLAGRADLPEGVADYVDTCGEAVIGSPLHAADLLGALDRLVLVERDPAAARRLAACLGEDPRCTLVRGDGFARVHDWHPASDQRGLLLLDPPYVEAADYQRVARVLNAKAASWTGGVLVAWYPGWRDRREQALHAALDGATRETATDLRIDPGRDGMTGSGLLVLNPPAAFATVARELNGWLAEALGRGAMGRWREETP